MNIKTTSFINRLFEGIAPNTAPEPIPAILYADNQEIATGQFDLVGRRDGHATFAKSSGDIPRNLSAAGIVLKLKDGPRLTLK